MPKKNPLEIEAKRIRSLSENSYLYEIAKSGTDMLELQRKGKGKSRAMQALDQHYELLLAAATDVQWLAMLKRDREVAGLNSSNLEFPKHVSLSWGRRADLAQKYGLELSLEEMDEHRSREIAGEINRLYHMHKELRQSANSIKGKPFESAYRA